MSFLRGDVLKRFFSLNSRMVISFQLFLLCFVFLIAYYFFSVSNRIEDEVFSSLRRDGTLAENQIDSMISTAIKNAQRTGYTTCLQKSIFSGNPDEVISNFTTARELISIDKDSNPFVLAQFYYSSDGHIYSISEYYKAFHDNMDIYGFRDGKNLSEPFVSKERIPGDRIKFYFVYTPIYRTAAGIAHHNKDRGVCGILCDFSKFLDDKESLIEDDYSCYILFNDEIVSSSNPIEGVSESQIIDLADGESRIRFAKEKYYLYSHTNGDWKVVCMAPRSATGIQKAGLDKSFTLVSAIVIFAFALFLFVMNTHVTTQTNHMIGELTDMKNSTEKKRVSIPHVSELKPVAIEINNMLDRIEESTAFEKETREKLLASEVAQKEAEMMAYRSQINPHFFFNTLECVRSMAQYYGADMIEDIISAMSKMFRYSLYSERTVHLSQEIDMLEMYFRIISYRFPDMYVLEKEIYEDVLDFMVPSMILQPLVENSIKHAFKNVDKPKKEIRIIASFTDDNRVRILVSDNGCGMTAQELEELKNRETQTRDSIGIRNIYERIKLFNENNTMEFFSEKGVFTTVELVLYESNIN